MKGEAVRKFWFR